MYILHVRCSEETQKQIEFLNQQYDCNSSELVRFLIKERFKNLHSPLKKKGQVLRPRPRKTPRVYRPLG